MAASKSIYTIQSELLALLQKKGITASVGNNGEGVLIVSVENPKTAAIPKSFKGHKIEVKKMHKATR